MRRARNSSNATGAGSRRVCAEGSGPELSTMHSDESPTAVEVVVALIIDLFQPYSVAEFGCNVGVWLDGFRRRGIVDVVD